MVPAPGETPGDWWADTGRGAAVPSKPLATAALDDDPDLLDAFLHDVRPDVTAAAMARGEPAQSSTAFTQPRPLKAWPESPTRILHGHDDRFFPVDLHRRVVQDRLGITPEEVPGGQLLAVSQPKELASRLERYRAECQQPSRVLKQVSLCCRWWCSGDRSQGADPPTIDPRRVGFSAAPRSDPLARSRRPPPFQHFRDGSARPT